MTTSSSRLRSYVHGAGYSCRWLGAELCAAHRLSNAPENSRCTSESCQAKRYGQATQPWTIANLAALEQAQKTNVN